MFGKRKEKKEAEAQAQAAEKKQLITDLNADLVAAYQVEDPVQKVLKLNEVRVLAEWLQADQTKENKQKAKSSGVKANWAFEGPAVAGGTALALLATGPVGWAGVGLSWAGIIGGSVISGVVRNKKEKKLKEENAGHLLSLDVLADKAEALMRSTVEMNVVAISESPNYPVIMALPGLKDAFSQAAAQRLVDQQREIEEAKQLAAEAGDKPAAEKTAETPVEIQPREKQDFSHFTQFGRTTKKPPQP